MKIKHAFSILSLSLLFNNLFVFADDPVKTIYCNRDHFINILNHLSDGTKIDTSTHRYGFLSMHDFFCFRDSSFAYWKSNEASFIESFIQSISQIKQYRKYRYYIDDSVTISILASLLDYPDPRTKTPGPHDIDPYSKLPDDLIQSGKPIPNWSRDALHILTYHVYFSALLTHSNKISYHLNGCKEPELSKLKLLVLLKQPEVLLKKMRDSLILKKRHLDSLLNIMRNDTNVIKKQDSLKLVVTELENLESIPLWVMARMGDTISEQKIIKGLTQKDDNVYRVITYAAAASFVWSDSCRTSFLRLFNRDLPRCSPDEKHVLCRSIQDTLLVLLGRHHPTEPIFSNLLSSNRINADYCKPETQVPYFKTFSAWAKRVYGVNIMYPEFTPYFRKDLSKNKSAIRDYCK